MKAIDIVVTEEEQKIIRSLERLAKKWPQGLSLFSWAGSLVVMKNSDIDNRLCIVQDIIGIPNDGGDPDNEEVNRFPEIEWEENNATLQHNRTPQG